MLPFKEENIMINTNELANSLMTALDALETAKEMRAKMEASIIPMTIDAVNAMFQRIQNNIQPIVDAVSILCKDKNSRNMIIGALGSSRRLYFSITDIASGVCLPVIPKEGSCSDYYAFGCSSDKNSVLVHTTVSGSSVWSLCYNYLDKYVPEDFEIKMYEAVEDYVKTVLKSLQYHTKQQIEKTNKLTETLRRIAGDDIVNEILCKNIHVGNGIDGVRIHDGKVVVDICGQEYILNATKM